MGYDKRSGGGFGGGKGSFKGGGGRPSFGGERKEMFTATCATCNKPCEVPFRPTGERPVYCRDCFRAVRDDGQMPTKEFTNVPNRFAQAPKRDFAPRPAAPAAQAPDRRIDDLKKQVDLIGMKLDAVIEMMKQDRAVTVPAPVKVKAVAKKKVPSKSKKA